MKVDFPYPGYKEIHSSEVPDANLVGIFSPRSFDSVDEQKAGLKLHSNPGAVAHF